MSIYINNQGTIESNKDFTVSHITDVLIALKEHAITDTTLLKIMIDAIDTCEISFEDYYEPHLEEIIEIIVDVLTKDGYKLNGTIDYYGDYDGTIYVKDNKVTSYDKEDRWQETATIEELLKVLKSRGVEIMTVKESK